MTDTKPQDVLDFWREGGPDRWFNKDEAFDTRIRERFADTVEAARRGELDGWADTPDGLLALVIVLDQFPRNLFRNDARAFASDEMGIALARRAHARGLVDAMPDDLAVFALMPLMHSERIADQDLCVAAMLRPAWADNHRFARVHREAIARFGRFPHRNAVLGRHTTPAERDYLENGGFGG